MIKSLAAILNRSQSSSTPSAAPASSSQSTASPTQSTAFTLDSFQRGAGLAATAKGTGLKLDDGVPSFGGRFTNELKGFDAPQMAKLMPQAAPTEASALVDSVARSKAAQTVTRTAQRLMEVVGQNSWVDHVDFLRNALGGAASRLAEAVTTGAVSPQAALEQASKWERLVASLVHVPKGASSVSGDAAQNEQTRMKMDVQSFQHHRAIEALEGRADLDTTIRLVETVARVPTDESFSKRMGMIKELSGHTNPRDFLDFAGQFPALRDELLPQLTGRSGPAVASHGMGLKDEPTAAVASRWQNEVSGFGGDLGAVVSPTSQPAAYQASLAQAFAGPRVSSAEGAAAAARTLQTGYVSSFSAFEDAWGLAGDTTTRRAALDAALAKSGGVMTPEVWKALPAVSRDLYQASEVEVSFKENGSIALSKDGNLVPRKSLGGSGEGTFTMFKADGLNLVVDQHMGGYQQANGANVGNRNLAYIYESKLRAGADLLEFGRFDRELKVNGRPVSVGPSGLELADGSRLERLPNGAGYRLSTENFELDISYYHNLETGVPLSGQEFKNPTNMLEFDPSLPRTWFQSYQVRNKKPGPVQAEGLLGQVMTEQTLRAPDLAVEQKSDLWRMNLNPWLVSDFGGL